MGERKISSSAEDSLLSVPPLETKKSSESLKINFATDVAYEEEITPRKTRKKSSSFQGFTEHRQIARRKHRSMLLQNEQFRNVPPPIWKYEHLRQWLRHNNLEGILESLKAAGIRDGRSLLAMNSDSIEKLKAGISNMNFNRFSRLRADFLSEFRSDQSPREKRNDTLQFSFRKPLTAEKLKRHHLTVTSFEDDRDSQNDYFTAIGAQIGENSVQESLYKYPSRPNSNYWGEAASPPLDYPPSTKLDHNFSSLRIEPKISTILPNSYIYFLHCYFFSILSSYLLFFPPDLNDFGRNFLKSTLSIVLLLCFVCCTYLFELPCSTDLDWRLTLINRITFLCSLIMCFFVLGIVAVASRFDSFSDFILLFIGILSVSFFLSRRMPFRSCSKQQPPGEDSHMSTKSTKER